MILRAQVRPGEVSPASQPAACSPDEQPEVVDPNLIGVDCPKDPAGKTETRNQSFDDVFVVDARL